MRFSSVQIVFQEIPTEISLAISVTGCPLRCRGCHSSDLWDTRVGEEWDLRSLALNIEKYKKYITCVLYLGGEWQAQELTHQLDYVKSQNLKTALYTGHELIDVDAELMKRLDYIKYGRYDADLGALSSSTTNQRLINLKTNENLNHYFNHKGFEHDSIR